MHSSMVAALSWAARLKAGLARTRDVLNTPVTELLARKTLDASFYEELEGALLQADCGVAATQQIILSLRKQKLKDGAELKAALRTAVVELLAPLARKLQPGKAKPFVIMIAGVNGSGKTTSIGEWPLESERSVSPRKLVSPSKATGRERPIISSPINARLFSGKS